MINKQDYLNAVNQNIEMVRGDTLIFNFSLRGLGSSAVYEALTIEFNAAYNIGDAPSIVASNDDDGVTLDEYDSATDTATYTVCIAPEKTKDLDLSRFYYNLQAKDDENTITLMRGRLTLLYEID